MLFPVYNTARAHGSAAAIDKIPRKKRKRIYAGFSCLRAASDVIAIEAYGIFPYIGEGIRIKHNIPGYKAKVIFWTLRNPNTVVRKIRETGFLNQENT